ncbi:MAG: hypothetical protein KatS3mg031_2744 [Chitinophagales bacterium]|nr:MAG: hypothetical protein KatS3mg031_2744 [Chitinophagales bacterium]
MKKYLLLPVVLIAVVCGSVVYQTRHACIPQVDNESQRMISPAYTISRLFTSAEQEHERERYKESDGKIIKPALEYLGMMRNNQITGTIDFKDVYQARQQALALRNNASVQKRSLGLQWEELGPDNVGGRTRGFLINRNNPQHILAGSVSGGLFVSYDGGLSWAPHPSNATMGNLSISTIRQASNGDIYVGTGEYFAPHTSGIPTNFGAPGFIGGGIFKSTDGGQTFTVLPSTQPLPNSNNETWAFVNEIAIDPNNPFRIFAATGQGLKISNDGGLTWTDPTGIDPPVNAASQEVVISSAGAVYAEINRKYYLSGNGTNFQNRTGLGGFPGNNIGRIEFAVSPQDPNYVYAVVATGGAQSKLRGIYRSVNGGLDWTTLIGSASETFDVLGFQGTWNIALGVDPNDKNRFWVGGQTQLWSWSQEKGWDQIASSSGESFTNPYYVHADMHVIQFDPTNPNRVFVANDGGIYRSIDALQQFPKFSMRNKGYNVTQFYSMAANRFGHIMGGSQDNGTQLIDFTGNTRMSAREVYGGDGGDCEMSDINPKVLFASTYSGRVYRSSNGGDSFSGFYDDNIDRDLNGEMDRQTLFMAATFLWEQDNSFDTIIGIDTFNVIDQRSIYFLGALNQLWFTPEALNFSTQPYWYEVELTGMVSEIEVSPSGTVFCGTTQGTAYRIEGIQHRYYADTTEVGPHRYTVRYIPDYPRPSRPNTQTNYPGWDWPGNATSYQNITRTTLFTLSGRYLTGIAVDPNNNNHIVLTFGNYGNTNYVYRSVNGTNFTSIQNNLPAMPVYDAVIDYYNADNLILATEMGIYASSDAGATWTEENNGAATVPAFKMFQKALYEDGCKILYVSTHGRGMFRSTSLTPSGCTLEPGLTVGVKDVFTAKVASSLQVYPNPASDKVVAEFHVVKPQKVSLLFADIAGRIVKTMELGTLPAGPIRQQIELDNVPTGSYLIILRLGETTEAKRISVTR